MEDTLISELIMEREGVEVCTSLHKLRTRSSDGFREQVNEPSCFIELGIFGPLFKKPLHHGVSAVIIQLFFVKSFFAYTK
jgi:hypothetical protein